MGVIRSTAILIALPVLLVTCADDPPPPNPNFDFSGVDQFWGVVEILEADLYPFQEVWDTLFASPGYAALVESEFTREFFMEHMQTAFMPSKAPMLKQQTKVHADPYLRHFSRVNQLKSLLATHRQWLIEAPMMREVTRAVRQYLPEHLFINYPPPPIAFVIFANDTRGYSPVVMDLLYSLDQEEHLALRMGHEAHHYYRNKLLVYDPAQVRRRDRDAVWVLNQIQAEGLADRVDRRVLYFQKGYLENMPEAQLFKARVAQVPAVLDSLDRLLSQIASQRGDYSRLGRRMRELLPMSGHAVGYYITSIIVKRFGNEELNRRVGNPFAFFHLYHLASIMPESNTHIFSPKSVAVVQSLQQRYSR